MALGTPVREVLDERAQDVLTLLLEARGTIEPAVQEFLEASERIEEWLRAGYATDAPTVRTFGPHVYQALLALDLITSAAKKVTSAALEVDARNTLDSRAVN